MRYKGYTVIVTAPRNAGSRGCTDPIFTIIHGGAFGTVEYQKTIHESFSSIAKGKSAAIAAARTWIDERTTLKTVKSGPAHSPTQL